MSTTQTTNTRNEDDEDEITFTTNTTGTVTLPTEINRFETRTESEHGPTVYHADNNNERIHVEQHLDDTNTPVIHLTAYHDNGSEHDHARIPYGPGTHRNADTASEVARSQIWQWGRFNFTTWHPAALTLTNNTAVNRFPPTEKYNAPVAPDTWYHSYRQRDAAVTTGRFNRTRYVPATEIELHRTTDTESWYCGNITITFKHRPADQDAADTNRSTVYGVTIRVTKHWMKPLNEREHEHADNHEHHRHTVINDDANTARSITELIDAVNTAKTQLVETAEPYDSDRRQAIIQEAERRQWDDDAGEYTAQTGINAYTN